MKKFLPLVALLVSTAIAAPAFAAEEGKHDAAPAAEKSEHKAAGHKAHKGHKGTHHKKGKKHCKHHMEREHADNGGMMEGRMAPAPAAKPEKVWMPSMRHGYQK